MRLTRLIMALVIATSVAMLPMPGKAVAAMNPAHNPAAVNMQDMPAAMDECCPDAEPCDQNANQCQSMASCLLQSVSMAGATASHITYAAIAADPLPTLTDEAGPPLAGSPPFRPPRV